MDKDVNQGRVAMMLPGILRDNPDYFAVMIMNDILGGGGFTSRIMNRVRSDEGLAYDGSFEFSGRRLLSADVHGGLSIQVAHGGLCHVHCAGGNEADRVRAGDRSGTDDLEARVHRPVPAHVRNQGASGEHLCPGRIHRPLRQGSGLLERPTARAWRPSAQDDVLRVAKKYLTPDKLVILAVGKKEDILLGHPDHPVKLTGLGGRTLDRPAVARSDDDEAAAD